MYASAKYHCCRTNSDWETDLNREKKQESHCFVKYRSEVNQFQTWPRNHDNHFKNVTPRMLTRFSFDLALWPSFLTPSDCVSYIIKTNILSKIHDDYFKKETPRVLIRFSFDLPWWPNFWPQVTQLQRQPKEHQDKHFEHDSWWLLQKCDL